MARTIAEIQQEMFRQKESIPELKALTNSSKTSIWKLWSYITASAIWTHEKIVEKNTMVSRPHTLSWYREQALQFVYGHPLKWDRGFFQFDTLGLAASELNAKKVVKFCAVGEVDLDTILKGDVNPKSQDQINAAVANYFHNQVGVIFMKVAGESSTGQIRKLSKDELVVFREYMRQIKDAGNQIQISSIDGDVLHLEVDMYVDPLKVYINPIDIPHYLNPETPAAKNHLFDENNGVLIAKPEVHTAKVAIMNFLKGLEFNGGLVRTYLIDALQKADGVEIPMIRKIQTGPAGAPLVTVPDREEYFIPRSGYFDLAKVKLSFRYLPYTFYRDHR
ncbi:conserved hypothetical protein [Tenacibaculum litopenaei]|uniref:hypothetical protein n=1 Tax=Tenacibaculum litopenaei TaxID=396016 RepID=UPI0038964265